MVWSDRRMVAIQQNNFFFQYYRKVDFQNLNWSEQKITWNSLNSDIVKCVTITDKLDRAGSKIEINSAFVRMFNGNTRPDTLK